MTGAMDVDHFQDVQIFDERGVLDAQIVGAPGRG